MQKHKNPYLSKCNCEINTFFIIFCKKFQEISRNKKIINDNTRRLEKNYKNWNFF